MLTENEMDNIVLKVTEKVLLRIPEVLGNLMKTHAATNKLTKNFYREHPEFKDNIVIIKSVLEQLERENAGMKYEEILNLAVPKIKERIKISSSLNTSKVKTIDQLELGTNGVL